MSDNPIFERAMRFLSALRHCQVLGLHVHSASQDGNSHLEFNDHEKLNIRLLIAIRSYVNAGGASPVPVRPTSASRAAPCSTACARPIAMNPWPWMANASTACWPPMKPSWPALRRYASAPWQQSGAF